MDKKNLKNRLVSVRIPAHVEDCIGKKNIRPVAIDTITGKEKELSFEEYLEMFK